MRSIPKRTFRSTLRDAPWKRAWRYSFKRSGIPPFVNPSCRQPFLTEPAFASPSTIEESYFFADGKRLEAARIEARCPVLVLQGAQDEYGTVAQIDAIRTGIGHHVRKMQQDQHWY